MKLAPKPKAGISTEMLRTIRRTARRAEKLGPILNTSILQAIREHLWKIVTESLDSGEVRKLLPLVQAGRRLELIERDAADERRTANPDQQEKMLEEAFGDLWQAQKEEASRQSASPNAASNP